MFTMMGRGWRGREGMGVKEKRCKGRRNGVNKGGGEEEGGLGRRKGNEGKERGF